VTNAQFNSAALAEVRIDEHPDERKQLMAASDSVEAAERFDYDAVAELFPARSRKFSRKLAGYRRFERAADAIRFAVEVLPPELLLGAYLEVEEMRFGGKDIRRLYASAEYPLARPAQA